MTADRAPALPVIVVAGPTAGGKTELAVELARRLGDSLGGLPPDLPGLMPAPLPELDARGRLEGVPFHFVSIADPRETFDAGTFGRLARERAAQIRARGSAVTLPAAPDFT